MKKLRAFLSRKKASTFKKIPGFFLAGFVVLALIGASYHFWHRPPPIPPNKVVEVAPVKKQLLQQTVTLMGVIHPKHSTVLVAKANGLLDVIVPTGEKVTKGQLIAKMDNLELQNNLQLSEAEEILNQKQLDRLKFVLDKGIVSAREFEEKKQAWIESQKEVSRNKIELNNLQFTAPFEGIVGAYKLREGTQVRQGDPVVSIYDPKTLVIDFDIPCSNLSNIKAGLPLKVMNISYTLTHVQKMLDEDTHMCPADADIQCDNCLIGSAVPVELVILEKPNALLIPYQAIFLRDGKPFVYIVEAGKIQLVAVKTGAQQQDHIEVLSGLKAGQPIVIKGQERLYPEMTVDILPSTPMSTASP